MKKEIERLKYELKIMEKLYLLCFEAYKQEIAHNKNIHKKKKVV
jgi:hypothetical protein